MVLSLDIDSNSDDEYPSLAFVEYSLDYELELDGIQYVVVPLSSYGPNVSPIEKAKAAKVSKEGSGSFPYYRHRALKPLWVSATIYRDHVNTGEASTNSKFTWLSEIIRNRGIYVSGKGNDANYDNCGHIIANSLGGKMVDFNLFPQNRALNSGLKSNYVIWKMIETTVKQWVTLIPRKYNPRLKFQMLLYYDDPKYPDRPYRFKYSLRFLKDDDSSDEEDDNENDDLVVCETILNTATVALQVTSVNLAEVIVKVRQVAASMKVRCREVAEDFLKDLSDILGPIPPPKYPEKPIPVRQRGISVWDFVPVVGSVKTIVEGCEDLSDGNTLSGAVNLGLGAGCLTLDFITLGSYSAAMRGIGKLTAKEVAKGAARQATSKIIQKSGEAAIVALGTYTITTVIRRMNSK